MEFAALRIGRRATPRAQFIGKLRIEGVLESRPQICENKDIDKTAFI
jgi:hypothetical protein